LIGIGRLRLFQSPALKAKVAPVSLIQISSAFGPIRYEACRRRDAVFNLARGSDKWRKQAKSGGS
jgi:hypothetical protein